jgi:energy-coupling factor transporter ATP-binding protein EcfA2
VDRRGIESLKIINLKMKITKIELEKFCAFRQASLEFCPGINVFIGANGTGKSHLMKVLYSVLKANEHAEKRTQNNPNNMLTLLSQKLMGVFRPDPLRPEGGAKDETEGLGRLVTRGRRRACGSVQMETDAGKIFFELTTLGNFRLHVDDLARSGPAVFLPAREVLSMFEGFVSAYKTKLLSFDETYFDLCVALDAAPARGAWPKDFAGVLTELERVLGGRVHQIGGRFYIYNDHGVIESHLLAEGFRKLGTLFRLMQNESLARNGFLFWDEPESNLNPKMVTLVCRILRCLASSGVQVFVASHDYLLTHELSLAAEYPEMHGEFSPCPIRFFGFSRQNEEGSVSCQQGDILADLDNNPILDEFAALYDRRRALFDSKPEAAKQ